VPSRPSTGRDAGLVFTAQAPGRGGSGAPEGLRRQDPAPASLRRDRELHRLRPFPAKRASVRRDQPRVEACPKTDEAEATHGFAFFFCSMRMNRRVVAPMNRRPSRARSGYRRRQARTNAGGDVTPRAFTSRRYEGLRPTSPQTIAQWPACYGIVLGRSLDQRGSVGQGICCLRLAGGAASTPATSAPKRPRLEVAAGGSLPCGPGSCEVSTVGHPRG